MVGKGSHKKTFFGVLGILIPNMWNHPHTPGFLRDLGSRKVKCGSKRRDCGDLGVFSGVLGGLRTQLAHPPTFGINILKKGFFMAPLLNTMRQELSCIFYLALFWSRSTDNEIRNYFQPALLSRTRTTTPMTCSDLAKGTWKHRRRALTSLRQRKAVFSGRGPRIHAMWKVQPKNRRNTLERCLAT